MVRKRGGASRGTVEGVWVVGEGSAGWGSGANQTLTLCLGLMVAGLSLCLRRCGGMIAVARDFDRLALSQSGKDIVVVVARAILGGAGGNAVAVTHLWFGW